MSSHRSRRLTGVVALTATAVTGVALTGGPSTAAPQGPTVPVQILSFNDFHGNLEAPSGSGGRVITGPYTETRNPTTGAYSALASTTDAGGVEYLSTHLAQARQGHERSLTVAAGDIVGASPLLSAAFHDEPTIEAMNALRLDATAVGNHEFDEGYQELQRLDAGGCLDDGAGKDNQDSCPGGATFGGADFDILAANVKYSGTDETILPGYTIKNLKGVKIGFIGMTLKDTPSIVTQAGVQGLDFTDEVETANALVPVLREQGVKAIVVLLHQGGSPSRGSFTGPSGKVYTNLEQQYDYACAGGGRLVEDSAVLPIARDLDPQIDMIVSGHTHQPYVCDVPDPAGQPRLVTSASSFGRLFTETTLTYDRRTQDIVRSSVEGTNVVVTRTVPKDPTESQIIARYKALVAPIESKVIGTSVTKVVSRSANAAGESPLGDLIADAQRADTSLLAGGGAAPQIAFMNPGGIRSDLTSTDTDPAGGYDVTYGQAFSVQPFNNYVVAMTMTGAQIHQLLAQQFTGGNASSPKVLQVSEGFTYAWNPTTKTVVPGSVKLGGVPVPNDASTTYRVAANSFLSDGGDNFPAFAAATDKYIGGLDVDAFAAFLTANPTYAPPMNRIALG